jgi:hypothetical protein
MRAGGLSRGRLRPQLAVGDETQFCERSRSLFLRIIKMAELPGQGKYWVTDRYVFQSCGRCLWPLRTRAGARVPFLGLLRPPFSNRCSLHDLI